MFLEPAWQIDGGVQKAWVLKANQYLRLLDTSTGKVSVVFGWGAARGLVSRTGQGALNANLRVDVDVWGLGTPLGEAQFQNLAVAN